MISAVAKGQYWKERTAVWLRRQGYVVAYLERLFSVWTPQGQRYVKRDQMGSDLIAVNRAKTVFVQAKGGESARSQLAAARKEFAKYPLSAGDEQWIAVWLPRARAPEILVVAVGPQDADHPVIQPARRKPKVLPLFTRAT